MKRVVFLPVLLALCGVAQSQPWLAHDLSDSDLRNHSAELVGQPVTVLAGAERRWAGGPKIMLWLSSVARAHTFGPERGNYCIWAVDKSGRLAAMKQWSIVRVKGIVGRDNTIKPHDVECPSDLVVSVSNIEVLPDYPTK